MQWQVSEVSEVSEKVKIGTAAAFGLLALPWLQLQSTLGAEAGSCPADPARSGCASVCPAGRILVLGAGLAGLTAAQTLRRAGCEVLLLEASGRVGGRASAIETGPFRGFDAGAQWVHGGEENVPIMALTRFFNLSLEQIGGNTDFEGRPYSKHRLLHLQRANDTLKAEAFRHYAEAKVLFDQKVGWILAQKGADLSLRSAWELIMNQSLDPLLEWQLRVRSEQNWGTSAEQVGSRLAELAMYSVFYSEVEDMPDAPPSWRDSSDMRGDAKLAGGFSALVRELAQGLDVRFHTAATSISLEDSVTVHTSSATYQGKAVIVTVPLTVLQQKIHFQPPLSSAFHASLNRFQMGDVAKLFIKFKVGESPMGSGTYLISQLVSQTSRSLLYYCIREAAATAAANVPSVTLTCLLSGPSFAEALKLNQSQEALRARVVEELLQMFPQMQPTAVEAVLLVSFSRDPFVLGSWTCGKVGSSSQDFSIYEPKPRLAFAGEHTCRLMYGTVQAAVVSGARAAHQVLAGRPHTAANDDWPYFNKELYSLCDELPNAWRDEHCGESCLNLWPPLPDTVPSLFQHWQGMTKKARRCWGRLGWRSLSWARQARKPASSFKTWLQLSSAEQEAAACVGFAEETWNDASGELTEIILCRSGSPHFQLWDCLAQSQQRDWRELGFNRATLNEEVPSALATVSWSRLTPLQRRAAIRIGYRPWMW
ncbi:PAO4 [Symbiodinium natans]|uniref:PAO4 protein n=1 Tax=Symbiodinium natans TaxID=878477 RepID=A0A812IEX7_9DINO|nr:PAO4 [Symbiodinium natans]